MLEQVILCAFTFIIGALLGSAIMGARWQRHCKDKCEGPKIRICKHKAAAYGTSGVCSLRLEVGIEPFTCEHEGPYPEWCPIGKGNVAPKPKKSCLHCARVDCKNAHKILPGCRLYLTQK